MRRATIGWLALTVCVGFCLAALPHPADAQIVCAKTNKKGKTKFKLRDSCTSKETVAIDLATTSTGLDGRVTDLEMDVTGIEADVTGIDGDIVALQSNVGAIESDLMTVRVPDSCTWIEPFSVSPIDPRGCAPGINTGDTCTTTTTCDAGQFAAAGACKGDPSSAVDSSVPFGDTGWTCELVRTGDVLFVSKWTAGVLCCE